MSNVSGAAGNNPQLRNYLQDLDVRIGLIESRNSVALTTPPTKPPVLTVVGQDGHFTVTVTPPAGAAAQVQYWIQSSLTLQFDGAGDVLEYGPSLQTTWDIKLPNQSRYWRVKASYDAKNWPPAWTYFVDPTICGPAPVSSGLLNTSSLSLVNSATTPNGANPLTQDGTTKGIIIADSQWPTGNQVINYTGGEIHVASYSTYYVYADDPKKLGGLPTGGYHATQAESDVTAADGRVFFGKITLASGGGGSGSGGGNGGCTIAGTKITMHDGNLKPVEQLQPGDVLMGLDGGPEVLQGVDLLSAPAFCVTTSGGKTLGGASGDHPLQRAGGGFDKLRFWTVGEPVMLAAGSPDSISSIAWIGMRLIFRLHLDRTKTYIADGFPSHNSLKA